MDSWAWFGRCACGAVVVLAVLAAAGALSAQALVNPDFDVDVSAWTPWGDASVVWDALDAAGDPASGSALVTNLAAAAFQATGAYQCVDGIQDGDGFGFTAQILIPGNQTPAGEAYLLAQWYSTAGCHDQLSLITTSRVGSSSPDAFRSVSGWQVAPTGAVSVRVTLSVLTYDATGPLAANFDDVHLIESLFLDGFETGDTNMWTATSPP